MKFVKSVSFDKTTLDIIQEYMETNGITNFSAAVCDLITKYKKFYRIAMKMQGRDDLL